MTMELRVIGCHGGETPRHRTSAFIVDDRLAIDAGFMCIAISAIEMPIRASRATP